MLFSAADRMLVLIFGICNEFLVDESLIENVPNTYVRTCLHYKHEHVCIAKRKKFPLGVQWRTGGFIFIRKKLLFSLFMFFYCILTTCVFFV